MRSFLPFAALLGVALVLGCQDVGTGPDGLVPQFDKKGTGDCADKPHNVHCHDDDVVVEGGDPSYTVTHDVSFLTVTNPITDGRSGGKKGTAVSIGHALDRKPAVLSQGFIDKIQALSGLDDDDIDACFGDGAVGLSAQFRARNGYVEGQYYFLAKGTDGEAGADVLYSLDLTGGANGDVAPDLEDGMTTIDWDKEGIFFRQGSVPACVGDGSQGRLNVTLTLTESITIAVTPEPTP